MRVGIRLIIWTLGLWGILFGCPPVQAKKIRVLTTTTDLAAITREIGGDRVEVKAVARGYQDPHYVEAKPSYIRNVNRADLLIYVGLQLEVGWLPLLIQGAHNNRVLPGASGNLDVSAGIRVLEVPSGELSRIQGDIHPEGNPHYWLDPRNGLIIAQTIAGRLSVLSPEDATYFQANLVDFSNRLQARIADWEARMAPYRGLKLAAYHKQWEYLADWLGWTVVDYVEDKPGIPPSPKHVLELTERIRREQIKLLLSANYTDPKISAQIAQKTGTTVLILPPSVEGEEGIKTYFDLFEWPVTQLEKVLTAERGE